MTESSIKLQKPWNFPIDQLLTLLETSQEGLSDFQVKLRLRRNGDNQIIKKEAIPLALRLWFFQFKNWLMVVLLLATVVSFVLGERLDSLIIFSIVILSTLLGFFQEYKAEKTLQKLEKFISYRVKVKRNNQWLETDSQNLVLGDIVKLQAGDLVPADIRLINLENLSANESVLTGESLPVSKEIGPLAGLSDQPQKLTNMLFMGTNIVSGYGEGVVVATGNNTFFGKTALFLEKAATETEFQKEIRKFSSFLFKVIMMMTLFIFLVNWWLNKGLFNSFFFAVALAVGITPELLPIIMTITLSQGALKMARQKVVVKRLSAVEDLGNMNILCTDKTGTLTQGTFSLCKSINVEGKEDEEILKEALICTDNFVHRKNFSSNAVDQALWESNKIKFLEKELASYKPIGENEFDFKRRRMSVLVCHKGRILLVAKGSWESIFAVSRFSSKQKEFLFQMIKEYEEKGYRVIAVAEKELHQAKFSKSDEKNLSLRGLLLFSDPVKANIEETLTLFLKLGVKIKILSGDSLVVTRSIAQQVGLKVSPEEIISGEELEGLSKNEFKEAVRKYNFFARVTPEQKYQIVTFLSQEGHVVGFLGDGINDAPALKAADVGIAVDSGAPIAKEAADIVLLKKDLKVLVEGIEAGRKTFGNTMKYIMNTISANFGNMSTVAISSLFLSFIPLLPKQIILMNFITDLPLLTIATDNVETEFIQKPQKWNIRLISRFMVYFGFLSSFFDLALILPMIFVWKLTPEVFRSAWFVESSLSEMLVTFVLRTKLSFYKTIPSKLLISTSLLSSGVVVFFPLLNLGQKFFEFTPLPFYLWIWIGTVLLSYFSLTEAVKHAFFKRFEK